MADKYSIIPENNQTPAIGLIAGAGRLPELVAKGIVAQGCAVRIVGLAGSADSDLLKPLCNGNYREVGLANLGRWIRTFRKWSVRDVVMVGGVSHTKKYDRFIWLRHRPDWRAAILWFRVLRNDRRSGALLSAVADELAKNGVILIDNRTFIKNHLAQIGTMTKTQPNAALKRDIEFAWPLLRRLVDLGVGQSIAVRNCDIIAVEAAEGTTAMVQRASDLCSQKPFALLKTCNDQHDMRADVPTIGIDTITQAHLAGCKAIVLGANCVIMIDREEVIAKADELGIAIVGIHEESAPALPDLDNEVRVCQSTQEITPTQDDAKLT